MSDQVSQARLSVSVLPLGHMVRYGTNTRAATVDPQDVTHCTDCGCRLRRNNNDGICAPCDRKARA